MVSLGIPRKDRRGLTWRLLTARWRVLPQFLLIGMMRSGTTTLFDQICAHPQVTPPRVKEVHYFNNRYRYPLSWYRAHFPLRGVSGEATAPLLFDRRAPARVAETLGRPRLLAILRDPIERAISHHRMLVARRPDMPSLAALLTRDDLPWRTGVVLPIGRYELMLPRWFERFGDDLMVVLHEDYRDDPQGVMDHVYAHLGLPPHRIDPEHWRHRAPPTTEYDALRPALAAHYAPTRAYMTELLSRELPWQEG